MDPIQRLPFAQYPLSHFVPEEWDEIWNQPGIDLDPYLTLTMYPGGTFPTIFHHELEFMGYAYRVNFDANWMKISAQWMKKISFTRGTAVKHGAATGVILGQSTRKWWVDFMTNGGGPRRVLWEPGSLLGLHSYRVQREALCARAAERAMPRSCGAAGGRRAAGRTTSEVRAES